MEKGGEHWKGSGLFPQYPSPPAAAPDTHTVRVSDTACCVESTLPAPPAPYL